MLFHNSPLMEKVAEVWHRSRVFVSICTAVFSLGSGLQAFGVAGFHSPMGLWFTGLTFCCLSNFIQGLFEAIFHFKGARDHAGNIAQLEKEK